ncbi:MAG: flavodoxin family protein, partial [Bacteroidales bacterium]|nr:flavodoxin family protein [Bacteroidales bacterium]
MILYFSGTGNSLAIARQIAEKVGDKIMPLREAVGKDLTGEKRIGLVFPTYWLDAPIAVRDIVPQLNISPSSYTFVVITCGAQTNNAVWTVRRILRQKGVKISYCNKIRVPDSSALAFGRNPNNQAWKFERYAPRLEQILNDIADEKHGFHYAGFDPLGWLLNRP